MVEATHSTVVAYLFGGSFTAANGRSRRTSRLKNAAWRQIVRVRETARDLKQASSSAETRVLEIGK